ncbi:hypothetical protein BJ944DRAFT_241858 [Cunninghamella echinulata]|nr:hypothetical protein BJ944DRAFT_241858 [Cunninghamella echinulata]
MISGRNIDNHFIPPSSPTPSTTSSTSSSNSIKGFLFATRGFKQRTLSQSNSTSLSGSPSNRSSMQSQRSQLVHSFNDGLVNHLNIPQHNNNSNSHYYTTTGDYDGAIINHNNHNNGIHPSRQPSLSNSTENGLSHSSSQRSQYMLNPPSMYDVRNSYDEPTPLSMYESNFTNSSSNGSEYTTNTAINNNNNINNIDDDNNSVNNMYPPSLDMQRKAQYDYQQNENMFKVIYAGIVSFKAVTALIPVVKKNYFVLTNHHLLQYKSEQKARSEINLFDHDQHHQHNNNKKIPKIDPSKIVLQLSDIFAVHTVVSPPNTFRIEYLQSSTKHHQALIFTANSEKECQQWVNGLRKAIKVHHVAMMSEGTITSTERFAAVDRLSKQKDMVDKRRHPLMIHKAIYKEKRVKIADGKRNTKEVFQVVTLAIGKFSLYLLPPSGVMDNEYLKSVERDRYGLLSIHSIQYSGNDDTFKLLLGQIGHPTRQLVLVSTYCEYIIQHLRQAIHAVSISPLPLSFSSSSSTQPSPPLPTSLPRPFTYSTELPSSLERTYITPLQTLIDDEEVNDRDNDSIKSDPYNTNDATTNQQPQDILQFEIVLYAYCAAFNLNKARFNYCIYGPTDSRSFVLSDPHEVNESSSSYSKYELLAILRTIHLVNIFSEIILKQQSLKELEEWEINKDDSWTTPTWKTINVNNVLSNEMHGILSSSNILQRLDVTQCQIGSNMNANSSAITVIGLAMRNGISGIRSLFIGKNNIKATDLHSLLTGIRSSRKTLLELDVHECQLNQEQIELLLNTILSERPEKLRLLDISSSPKDPHPHHSHYRHQKQAINSVNHEPSTTSANSFEERKHSLSLDMVKSLLHQCKRLSVLRIRGNHISLQNGLFDTTQLKELDLGYNQLSLNDVNMLCKWMQHPSFNSLEALHVNGCGLNGHHLKELLIAITKSGNRRVHLNVGGNPVWREVMYIPKLCNALMQGEGPSSLSLAKTDWEDSTLREFLDCMRDNHTITHLDLSDIRVTGSDRLSDDTVRVMALMFERNNALVELKLNDNMTRSKDGCAEISSGIVAALDSLKSNRTLERLQMVGLGIGDVGAITLANVVSVNHVLKSLHLDENKITIDGYRALATAFESQGCTVVEFPKPRKDIRYQLMSLKETISELTQIENETKWFIMHSTGKDVKQAKTQLLLQQQGRQAAELNYKQILDVVESMLKAVQKNEQRYKLTHERTEELQLQAQSAAQEMAIAQLRLQSSRVTGANLSAVGAPRLRYREGSVSSYSSGSERTGLTSTINSPTHLHQQQYHMSRSHTWDSVSNRMGTSPVPNYTYEEDYHRNQTSMSDYPSPLSPTTLYSHYEDIPNQPLPPTPQLLGDVLVSYRSDASVGGFSNHSSSGGSNASLSRRNTATTTSTNFVTTPRTPYGTPSQYNQPSPSTSMSFQQQHRMRRSPPDHQEMDHPGFIDDFGTGYSSSSMKPLQQQQQQQQQSQQYHYQKSKQQQQQQQKLSHHHHHHHHQQQQQQQLYRLPDIPDIYSVDSLQNEDRICEQFQNRLYLPPDERN